MVGGVGGGLETSTSRRSCTCRNQICDNSLHFTKSDSATSLRASNRLLLSDSGRWGGGWPRHILASLHSHVMKILNQEASRSLHDKRKCVTQVRATTRLRLKPCSRLLQLLSNRFCEFAHKTMHYIQKFPENVPAPTTDWGPRPPICNHFIR
jgi:hypothetical protein